MSHGRVASEMLISDRAIAGDTVFMVTCCLLISSLP
jgi:hypothetical protein